MPRCLVVPAARRSRCSCRIVVVADHLERPVECGVVVAAVEDESGTRRVREGVGRDEVAAPHLRRVDAHLRGERVHRPFDRVRGLGPAGAAVRVGRRLGGEHPGARERVGGDVVRAVVEERAEQRDAGRDQLEVRAHVGEDAGAHRGHLARRVGRELDVLDLAATLDRRHRVLAPLLDPHDRSPQPPGQREGEDLLGVHVELRTEGAAHGRRDDAQLVLGQAARDGEHDLEDVGDLRRRVDRELARERLWYDAHAARLDGRGNEALVHVPLVDGVRRGGERGVDRGRVGRQLPRVRRVGAELLVEDDGVGHGIFEIDHRGQRRRTRRAPPRRRRALRTRLLATTTATASPM